MWQYKRNGNQSYNQYTSCHIHFMSHLTSLHVHRQNEGTQLAFESHGFPASFHCPTDCSNTNTMYTIFVVAVIIIIKKKDVSF